MQSSSSHTSRSASGCELVSLGKFLSVNLVLQNRQCLDNRYSSQPVQVKPEMQGSRPYASSAHQHHQHHQHSRHRRTGREDGERATSPSAILSNFRSHKSHYTKDVYRNLAAESRDDYH
mmetsp:Transcript_25570/g.36033  ORF Transcript_25570/g.36033 Transcript_25570/m.36033 type:complete len:119 (+) Transcript_25570:572-928(+)